MAIVLARAGCRRRACRCIGKCCFRRSGTRKQYTTWFGKFQDPKEWRSKRNTITETGEAPDEESAKIFNAHYKFAIGELQRPTVTVATRKNACS